MLTYFKPTPSGKGAMASLALARQFVTRGQPNKEGAVFLKLIRQTSWNNETKTGSFKGGDSVNIKLNVFELGKLAYAIENNTRFSTYHSTKDKIGINFAPWMDAEKVNQMGMSINIMRDREGVRDVFNIGWRLDELVVLREFFLLAIRELLIANDLEEQRQFSAAKQKNTVVVGDNIGYSRSVEIEEDNETSDEALFSD